MFGIKRRSLPNEKNWFDYLGVIMYPVFFFSIGGPSTLVLCILFMPILCVYIYIASEAAYRKMGHNEFLQLILYIQMNHLQTLSEELEEKPEILHLKYKQKSLLYWARYYNNVKAHTLIVNAIRKSKNIT